MFLRFGPTTADEDFSYILSKNPYSPPFVRELAGEEGARRVVGQFRGGPIAIANEYEVVVLNDAFRIMESLRASNQSHYVSDRGVAVNAYNLSAAHDALDSALKGKVNAIGAERFFARKSMKAMLGPFSVPREPLLKTFTNFGLNPVVLESRSGTSASTLELALENVSVTEFLQRVFVASLIVRGNEDKYLDDERVRSLMERCKDWINTVPGRERIVQKLTGYRAKLGAEFKEKVSFEPESTEEKDGEKRIGLHTLRHTAILNAITTTPKRIVDLGCGDGKLTALLSEKFPEASILAIDGNEDSLDKMRRGFKKRPKTMLASVTMPFLEQEDLEPDVLVLCEVIEHLIRTDRRTLLDQIRRVWRPETLILTTPNVEYNAVWGIEPGKMRHYDHVIEYTPQQCWDEVIAPLADLYEFQSLPLLENSDLQPSFVLVGNRRKAGQQDLRPLHVARSMVSPYEVEEVGVTVDANEVRMGVRTTPFRHHREEIFYLSPTMAPVEWSAKHPEYLEYPETALQYYRERGVDKVIVEYKYMGSRGHVAYFRTLAHAQRAGFKRQLTVISRSGYPFFEDAQLADFEQAFAKTKWDEHCDYVLFDCEIMPWKAKATGLIERSFRLPGECLKIDRAFKGEETENTEAFLRALDTFAADGPVHFVPFGILATGQVGERGYFDTKLGTKIDHLEQISRLRRLFSEVSCVKPCRAFAMTTEEWTSTDRPGILAEEWLEYTKNGGEGFVIKPLDPNFALPNGVSVQPALKVRGKEYLRLIYGADYTEPEYLAKLKHRNVKAKRRTALVENALGQRILLAHLRGMRFAKDRALAAYLGVDDIASSELDRTL